MKSTDIFPSKYLKSADLQGREPTVIIARVVMEDFTNGERKPIMYFQGKEKGMVLNRTNWDRIAFLYGDESDDWAGKRIQLYVELVNFQGKTTEGLRVRPPRKTENSKPQAQHVVQDHGTYSTSTMKPVAQTSAVQRARQIADENSDFPEDSIPF